VESDSDMGRRRFVEVGIYAVTGAIAVASSAALALFTIGPSLSKKRSRWVEVKFGNPPSEGATFTRVVLEYETKDGWLTGRARKLAYVKRVRKDHVIAISADCSHLGCVVTWDEGQKMFNCPCHKGRFDAEGRVISGPPSAPLQRHKTRMDNGKLFLATEPVPNGEDASEGV
jgi:menaquinol-cytochrome c reductase iron-sulfur subunit